MKIPLLNIPGRRPLCAFTLVEILVSLGVVALLTVILAQMTNGTTTSMRNSCSRLDADQEARTVFDRIGSDLAAMSKDRGVDFIFSKQEGNDKLFFFSEVPGNFSSTGTQTSQKKSHFSLVGYRLNADVSQPAAYQKLERVAKGIGWQSSPDAATMTFLTFSGTGSFEPLAASTIAGSWSSVVGTIPDYNGIDPDYSVLSEFVYRLEFCFQLKDGTYSNKPIMASKTGSNNLTASRAPTSADSGNGYAPGSRWYDTVAQRGYVCVNANTNEVLWSPAGMDDVSSIIVAIAVLDPAARRTGSDLAKAISAFPDSTDADLASNPPKLIAVSWDAIRNQASFAQTANLNSNSAAKVYIYQRYFNLNSQ